MLMRGKLTIYNFALAVGLLGAVLAFFPIPEKQLSTQTIEVKVSSVDPQQNIKLSDNWQSRFTLEELPNPEIPVEPNVTPEIAEPALDAWELVGVIKNDAEAWALLKGPSGLQRISTGEAIEGFTLTAIGTTDAHFEKDEQSLTLRLKEAPDG